MKGFKWTRTLIIVAVSGILSLACLGGGCGQDGERVYDIHAGNFNGEVLESKQPVVVEFGASWCGPCRAMEPILNDLADANAGKVRFVRVDIDENQDLAVKYKATTIPTVIIFIGGREADRKVGFQEKAAMQVWIRQTLAKNQ